MSSTYPIKYNDTFLLINSSYDSHVLAIVFK